MKTYTKATCFSASEFTFLEQNVLRKEEIQLTYTAVYITKAFRLKSRLHHMCLCVYVYINTHTRRLGILFGTVQYYRISYFHAFLYLFFFISAFFPHQITLIQIVEVVHRTAVNSLLFKSLLTFTILMVHTEEIFMERFSYQNEAQVRKTLVCKGTVETGFNALNTT